MLRLRERSGGIKDRIATYPGPLVFPADRAVLMKRIELTLRVLIEGLEGLSWNLDLQAIATRKIRY